MQNNKLDFWIQNNYNVLMSGRHGVGKTSIIVEAFKRNNLKWKYFSAPTMDPWVDFVGVPKEKVENGVSYLDLVRPKEFQDDNIEAIFLDEYNRSPKKVRNAVMELIQFRSINGRKFNNLRIIWASINPEDGNEYDVERLDPAQMDRFHVHVELPYRTDYAYFSGKYGKEVAERAIAWWDEMPQEIRNEISPRRLDYALDIWSNHGDLRDVLPEKSNVSKLLINLKQGPILSILQKFISDQDESSAKKFLQIENNYSACIDWILKEKKHYDFFLPNLPKEKISSIVYKKNNPILSYLIANSQTKQCYYEILDNIRKGGENNQVTRKIDRCFLKNNRMGIKAGPAIHSQKWKHSDFKLLLKDSVSKRAYDRKKQFQQISAYLPNVLTKEEVGLVWEYINDYCNKTTMPTMKKMFYEVAAIINNCMINFYKIYNKKADEILKKSNSKKFTMYLEGILQPYLFNNETLEKYCNVAA